MWCNTNNGTERLNEELKYEDLVGHKHCTLSELLSIIIDSFLPRLDEKYIEVNVHYTSGYKKYQRNIPKYRYNRPQLPSHDKTLSYCY